MNHTTKLMNGIMIKFNDRFSFERDKYCWQLHESYMGRAKKGKEPKLQTRTTYHANLEQICGAIIDRSCGDCESIEEIIALLKNATVMLKQETEG